MPHYRGHSVHSSGSTVYNLTGAQLTILFAALQRVTLLCHPVPVCYIYTVGWTCRNHIIQKTHVIPNSWMSSRWVPSGSQMGSRAVPDEFHMSSRWVPDGFQMTSRWFPNDFQIDLCEQQNSFKYSEFTIEMRSAESRWNTFFCLDKKRNVALRPELIAGTAAGPEQLFGVRKQKKRPWGGENPGNPLISENKH